MGYGQQGISVATAIAPWQSFQTLRNKARPSNKPGFLAVLKGAHPCANHETINISTTR